MKLEAALITSNSPYAEVRSVVDNHDDPSMPVSTIRAWVLGLFFAGLISFINQLFSIRLPPITLTGDVAQLLSYPLGKAWDRWLPNWHIKIPFLKEPLQLNPGPFNKKEHMLIAIMAQVSLFAPYSNYIFWVQYLPIYFNQSYASSFGYMITNNLATIFIGYGLAGLVRRFLVYPSFCVWPASLVTVALNSALHQEENTAVLGPFKQIWHMSRYKFFMIAFGAMFVYFWIPNYLFLALSTFAWMTWIAPNNLNLNVLTGMSNGLGVSRWERETMEIVVSKWKRVILTGY
jgi:OPT family oligopeptide transporter